MSAGDTAASLITGHPFTPRNAEVRIMTTAPSHMGLSAPMVPVAADHRFSLQPNPHLCAICRLAEAAHARLSVQR